MKIKLLIPIFILILCSSVFAAMDPTPAFCQHMGYKMIGYSVGKYGTETIEKYHIYNEGRIPDNEFQYKGVKYTNLRDIKDISRRQDIKWDNPEYYCLFDDGNKCNSIEFYRGECGVEYVKTFPCRKKGEVVFHFEECCNGLSSHLPYMMFGQPSCQPTSKVITSWISAIPILLFFSPPGWIVLGIIAIFLIIFFIKRRKR